jgi:hypothetical protein
VGGLGSPSRERDRGDSIRSSRRRSVAHQEHGGAAINARPGDWKIVAPEDDQGDGNTANGANALLMNNDGNRNTATEINALRSNTIGNDNVAEGAFALSGSTSGSSNIALGFNAGSNLTTGSNNIDIGAFGHSDDSNTIRIGRPGLQNSTFIAGIFGVAMSGSVVVVNSSGKLGVTTSSARKKRLSRS